MRLTRDNCVLFPSSHAMEFMSCVSTAALKAVRFPLKWQDPGSPAILRKRRGGAPWRNMWLSLPARRRSKVLTFVLPIHRWSSNAILAGCRSNFVASASRPSIRSKL